MTKNISKTLIIGLGGTGQRMIRDIKKSFLRTYGEIPPLVELLAFDTDNPDYDKTPFRYYYDGEMHEAVDSIVEAYHRVVVPRFDVMEHYPVCSDKLNIAQLQQLYGLLGSHGGAFRVLGRASFLYNSQEIIETLAKAITSLRKTNLTTDAIAQGYRPPTSNAIRVYVIASLAGGMGSSAIMDISRMLQVAGINVDNLPVDCIYGMFFTPSFFEGKPGADYVRVNAYAALSELDYTMGLSHSYSRHRNYAPSSQEIADDRNDYAGYPNDKRVEYFGVYLIDSFTNNGCVHTLEEASRCVASYITCSMALDRDNIGAMFCVSAHKWHAVDGKYQNYSGLGYGELRFNRQELVRYLLNRKLLESLSKFKDVNGLIVSQIAQNFIDTNHLNEGVEVDSEGNDTRSQLNQLTDAIINMSDERFTNITMASVDTGNHADANIEANKTTYLNLIGAKVNEVIREFETTKNELYQKLRETLDKYQAGMGFGSFPDLALSLRQSFVAMKKGLEQEATSYESKFYEIVTQLNAIKNTISQNSSKGFLGIGNKRDEQEAAILSYCHKVRFTAGSETNPTLAWLKVESARKAEAIAVYEELIKIVDEYYKKEIKETINGKEEIIKGTYLQIDGMYDSLTGLLIGENNSYKPAFEAKNKTVFADAYFKDYFESHWDEALTFNDQAKRAFYEYIGNLFGSQPIVDAGLLAQMREKLLELLGNDDIVKRIHGYTQTTRAANGTVTTTKAIMSIDELFVHCFGTFGNITNPQDLDNNPQLKLLGQVVSLFDPLWSYLKFYGEADSLRPAKCILYGVYDMNKHIFHNGFGGYSAILPADFGMLPVALGDPDRITFMLWEIGIPGHKLKGVEDWAEDYDRKKEYVYAFSDRRLENIAMIMP